MNSGLFKNVIYKMCLEIIYLIYMYKKYQMTDNGIYALKLNQTKLCISYLVQQVDRQIEIDHTIYKWKNLF